MRVFYWLLVVVPTVALALFYLYPLSTVIHLSVTVPEPGFGNYARLLESEAIQRILGTTLRIAALTTVSAVVLGYALAYAIITARPPFGTMLLGIVLASFWLSVLVRAFAWLTLLQSRGVINTALMSWGMVDHPLPLVRNELGVLIGMVHFMVPYAVLPLLANMQAIDVRLVKAAANLGASRLQAFRMVFLPLSLPGVIASSVLCFVLALGFYITPALLGGGRVIMIAEYITVQIQETLNWGLGTMLATTLLAGVMLLMLLLARVFDLKKLYGAK